MARWFLKYTAPQKYASLIKYLFLTVVSSIITFVTITSLAPKIHTGIRPMSLFNTDPTVNNTQCFTSSMFIKSKDFQQAVECIRFNEDKCNNIDSLKNITNNCDETDHGTVKSNVPKKTFTNISRCSNEGICDLRSLNMLARKFKVNQTNCKAIFSGNKTNVDEGIRQAKQTKRPLLSNSFYLNLTENCDVFKISRGYVTCSMTQEEEEFPIAFSILAFKDIEMVERLFRAIYRPQNYYCIHVDSKADKEFFLAVSAVAQCFTNVFLTAERVDVQWGKFSVLEPELVCMKQLWRYTKWKYFINLTGQEFPLKTNAQLVKILKAFHGANDIEGIIKRANFERWPTQPPRGLRPVKGAVHVVVNRDFVDYIINNDTAKDLLEWVKGTGIPDETFFATLNHNPQLGIRGSYKGDTETDEVTNPFNARFKNWIGTIPCAGRFVREICILSTGDLPLLFDTTRLFANKFYLWEDFLSVGCLEEKLMNDTRDEFQGVKIFNVSYYESLAIVKNRVV